MKSRLKILAINVAVLAAGILVLELLLGEWLDSGRLNRLNIHKDREFRYDVSTLYNDPSPIIAYTRDQYGLRGSHVTPGNIDMLAVGGSTTDQRFIRDGATWQDVLQEQFLQTGVRFTVANAGVDGQSSYGHIKNFKWWFGNIPNLEPDYILFYVGINDFYKEAGDSYDELRGDFNLGQSIKDNSAIWYLFRTLRGAIFARLKNMAHESVDFSEVQWTRETLQDNYDFMKPRLDEYAIRLGILADLSREFGAIPVFVSQPTRKYRILPDGIEGQRHSGSYDGHRITGVDYYYMIRRLDGITKAVALEKDVLFIDLGEHDDWVDTDFYDFTHMTPQGARKVGIFLHQALRDTVSAGEYTVSHGSSGVQ